MWDVLEAAAPWPLCINSAPNVKTPSARRREFVLVVDMAQLASDYVDITQLPQLLQQINHSAKEAQILQKNMGVQVAALKNEFGTCIFSFSLAAAAAFKECARTTNAELNTQINRCEQPARRRASSTRTTWR